MRETYTVDVVRGDRRARHAQRVTNAAGGGATFDKPVDNIGDKTFGGASGYATYANQHVYNVTIPGCATPGRVFVGQRKEPFYIAVGKIFDLINLNPLGRRGRRQQQRPGGQERQHASRWRCRSPA